MKLYLAAGRYVGTQADARRLDRGFTPAEVPTDKDGLIAYLNALQRVTVEQARFEAAPPPPPTDAGTCPKCHRTPRAAEQLAQGDDVEAIAEWLWRAEAWQLERLLGVVGSRVGELRK